MLENIIHRSFEAFSFDKKNGHEAFYNTVLAHSKTIELLFNELYGQLENKNEQLENIFHLLCKAHSERSAFLKQRDRKKDTHWFLSNELAGMSLYIDRFCGNIKTLEHKLDYFQNLGINFLHLMPIMESPAGESDGGYAVSDFRKVDERFGTLQHLKDLQHKMQEAGMYLMLDIVLNHTSHRHEWAEKARQGEKKYQDYFYCYDDRLLPDQFERSMPEVFPEASPGNFTFIPEMNKWVMTVFHNYQWDLNYTNPAVFLEMLDTILFYANLGVDVLRIDAPAFIWKLLGTSCQNLPQAHTILRLIKQCVQVSAPGMALLGEAIVAPHEIMKYFGDGDYTAKECDVAYNATQMALQWDALATGDTRVMLAAQDEILKKPYGTTWINYTRCHDDIGLGYDDYMIDRAGYNAFEHRKYIKDYYSGSHQFSDASGALFSVNPKTNDARISGTLASLCGLETALRNRDEKHIATAIQKILLMQAASIFLGGIPMLFYGDEAAYTNDYSYLEDAGKSYDNRWMHRPVIDWKKNERISIKGTEEYAVFTATKKMLGLRKAFAPFSDLKNIKWFWPHNIHVAGYVREKNGRKFYCLFNYSNKEAFLTWFAFREFNGSNMFLTDHWQNKQYTIGKDTEYLIFAPYQFMILEGS
ncbi:MAG: alpha-amylase family glycosyl hydrolase [Ferruginibacter sp.]